MHSSVVSLCDDPIQLKTEVAQLRNEVEEKEQALTEKNQRIEQLLDYILLLRKRQFGASADRTNKDQVSLFDEAELEQLLAELDLPSDLDADKPATQKKAKDEKKKPVRRPLPAHLDRIEKEIDLSDEEKAAMGDDWTFIGYDTSEQLAVIPDNITSSPSNAPSTRPGTMTWSVLNKASRLRPARIRYYPNPLPTAQ